MYNYYGDSMKLFNFGKKKINSNVMMHLIFETIKNSSTDIFELFDKVGLIYDEIEAQINIIAINYELCRYELYNGNDHDKVNAVIDKVYDQFFYSLDISNDKLNEYKHIMQKVNIKIKDILSAKKLLAPKEELLYRLLLEQLSINESVIDKNYINEFLAYTKLWINNAKGINDTYIIEDTEEDKKKNEYIDFRF